MQLDHGRVKGRTSCFLNLMLNTWCVRNVTMKGFEQSISNDAFPKFYSCYK